MAKSLNKAELIGNLTRDVELKYTPQGSAVASFGLATNRSYKNGSGERVEETEFHRIVAWGKLAEIADKFLSKGRKAYVQGRLHTRKFQNKEGADVELTEIVADDIIILDSKREEVSNDGI